MIATTDGFEVRKKIKSKFGGEGKGEGKVDSTLDFNASNYKL